MYAAEKNLLLGIRNRLRTATGSGGAGLSNAECDVEYDAMAPATVGHRYVAVTPGTWGRGQRHLSSGGVYDFSYSVNLVVVVRANHIPRDRTRDVFIGNLGALDELCDLCVRAVDFNYALQVAVNSLIAADTGSSTEGFIHPPVFQSATKPQEVHAEFFGGSSVKAGLMRTLTFADARRVVTR